jgi:hypothetical protein
VIDEQDAERVGRAVEEQLVAQGSPQVPSKRGDHLSRRRHEDRSSHDPGGEGLAGGDRRGAREDEYEGEAAHEAFLALTPL